jgi:hypothetical protein
MTVKEVVREFVDGRIDPETFNALLAEIPGPSTHPWQKLHTEWENSTWDVAECRRRARALLTD